MSKIKICGLFRPEDIGYVNDAKPDFAGFIMDFPKSHRSIDFSLAKNLIFSLDKDIKPVCVVVNKPIDYIIKLSEICDIIQLHGDETNEFISEIKLKMPNTQIWKAFKITCRDDFIKAQNSIADRVLLDNGYGTGEVFDWNMIEKFNEDFILAGGLNCENIKSAIEKFKPYALDLSSSVETDKIKDFNKIKLITDIVRSEK